MINLTIPVYPYMPSGNVYPWESPFFTEDIASYERNDARLFYISMGSEMGTRLLSSGIFGHDGTNINQIPLEKLLNRQARVLSIPKKAKEVISLNDINEALDDVESFASGDAIIVATGWGDEKAWKKLGEKFVVASPFFASDAAARLANFMKQHQSDLLLTDCHYLDEFAQQPKVKEWLQNSPWIRLPFPSEHAKAFLRDYPRQEFLNAWTSTNKLVGQSFVILGLSGCDQIKTDRVQINCLPLFIDDVGQAPCTVVAERI